MTFLTSHAGLVLMALGGNSLALFVFLAWQPSPVAELIRRRIPPQVPK